MNRKNAKAKAQLGVNISTARSRLRSDVLYSLAVSAGHKCFQCGGELDRESFTLEHKVPWLDSDDPKKNYFSLDNIAFSHALCNSSAGRKPPRTIVTDEDKRLARKRYRDSHLEKNPYTPADRRERYLKYGH